MIRFAIAILILLTASGREATAQDAAQPRLKELVAVTAELVRIGDLVDDAGAAAAVAVFRAPDLGQTGTVPVARVAEALKPHGLTGLDTGGLAEVVVTRLSRVVARSEIEARIAAALSGQHGFGDARNLAIAFDRDVRPFHVEATAAADLAVARLAVERRTGRFDVTFELTGSAAARRLPLRFTGTATETVEAATLTRAVARGEVIREADVVVERRPKAEVAGEAIGIGAAIGLSAKRALRPGQALRASDLMKTEVVARHEQVIIVYEAPGILLTVRGKALEAGAEGDLISVLNIQSNKTIQAEVSGPGQVVVTATTPRIAAAMAPASDMNRRRRAQ